MLVELSDEDIKLIHKDLRDITEEDIPNKTVDLILCDPLYNKELRACSESPV